VSITFEAVTKRFADGTVAVDALDLQVPAAQTVVLVGPSGCGKTTTSRMIKRLVEPTAGRILLDGQDVRTASPARLRRGIGYVIQQAGLFPHRTVEDNIATVPLLNGWRRARARARARELMDLLGLDRAMACRYPYQLSGGQQQRVATLDARAAGPARARLPAQRPVRGDRRGIRRQHRHRLEIRQRDHGAAGRPGAEATRGAARRQAAGYAYVVIDGTLISIDRIAADRPFCSGKDRKHG